MYLWFQQQFLGTKGYAKCLHQYKHEAVPHRNYCRIQLFHQRQQLKQRIQILTQSVCAQLLRYLKPTLALV